MQSRPTDILSMFSAQLRTVRRAAAIAVVLAWTLLGAHHFSAQVNVWTYHNDNLRTGANLSENTLTPANVNQNLFGLLFSCPVDGQVYAQPLVLSNVSFPDGSVHNVVFVATQHDSVYAFDADGPDECLQLWARTDFINPDNGITTFPAGESRSGDISPELGITATPVIDLTTGRLYVVVKTKEVRASTGECNMDTCNHYVQTLHALDVTTGLDVPGVGPTIIGDTVFPTGQALNNQYGYVIGTCVAGTGNGWISDPDGNNAVCFNAIREHVRSGLVLSNGAVYVAWASHGDNGPYHGWVIGYDTATLQQIDGAVFNTSPNGGLGGIWMGGDAPAVDADGNIYFSTGNGTFAINDTDSCTDRDSQSSGFPSCNVAYGDTVVKLRVSPDDSSLSVADYFTPFDQLSLTNRDADLASGGVLLLPDQPGAHPHVLVDAGKESKIFLIDRDNLGGYQICGVMCDGVLAHADNMYNGEADDTPAYLNTGTEQRVYYLTAADHLKAFAVSADPPSITKVADAGPFGSSSKGATPSISGSIAEDGTVFNAIVWAIQAQGGSTPAVLHAYDALAGPVLTELYKSDQAGLRDRMGNGLKFTVPTVANGKVYAGTSTGPANTSCATAPGCVDVFGLFPQ